MYLKSQEQGCLAVPVNQPTSGSHCPFLGAEPGASNCYGVKCFAAQLQNP